MKLYFLGTSHGVPAGDRFCSCYVLEVGKNLYILDAGAPVSKLLLELGKEMKSLLTGETAAGKITLPALGFEVFAE